MRKMLIAIAVSGLAGSAFAQQAPTIYVMNAASGAAADVFIDDCLWQTVRW